MQPISPYRVRCGNTNDEDSSHPSQPNARGAPTTRPDAADLPDLRDPSLGITTTHLMQQATVDSVRTRVRDQAMQQGLNAFRDAMTPEFHTPGGPAPVPITFQMTGAYSNQPSLAAVTSDPKVIAAAHRVGIQDGDLPRILVGRGTPDEIRRLTQSLIDRCGLPRDTGLSVAERVRKLMFDHHIGIDCAGYVQEGYLAVTGLTRQQAGFARDPRNECLDRLSTDRRYRSIEPGQLRPGDIGLLGPPSEGQAGHRVIVYDRHQASVQEMDHLSARGPDGAKFSAGGPVSVVVVDSSCGCGIASRADASPQAQSQRPRAPPGDPQRGGVTRTVWYYNGQTGQWGSDGPSGFQITPKGPYDHPLVGFYRRNDSESLDLPALKRAS
jgi:hypothetical protein